MRRERQKIIRRGWLIVGTTAVLSVFLVLFVLVRFGFFAKVEEGGAPPPTAGDLPAAVATGRHNVYDRNLQELAVSFRLTAIYARPLELTDIDAAAAGLAKVLEVDAARLYSLLKAERSFVWLGRQLPAGRAEKVLSLGIAGVYGIDEMVRFYPHGQAAAHVLGFVKDEQGLAGVEFVYDNVLRGVAGRDTELGYGDLGQEGVSPRGANLVLTLDLRIQSLLEQQLEKLASRTGAASAVAIIINPADGAVLAMVSLPTYDPNRFWDYAASVRRNRAITDPVFPGGLGRIFQAGAVFGQQGNLEAGGGDEAVPWVATGAGAYVSPALAGLPSWQGDAAPLGVFAERVGLNARTGIDLPDEQQGEGLDDVSGSGQRFRINDPVSATSALRLLSGFVSLLHDGAGVKPHLLAAVRDEKGEHGVVPGGRETVTKLPGGTGVAVLKALGGVDATGRRREFVAESLMAEQLIDSRFSAREKDSAGIEEQVAGGAQQAAVPSDRYYATLLGVRPAGDSSLAMVVALSGARFDPAAASPLAAMARQVLRQATALSGKPAARVAQQSRATDSDYYQAWRKLQARPDVAPVAAPAKLAETMPRVTGYSLRKALQALQSYGLPVRVEGSGRVVEQRPAAGESFKGSKEVVLKLRMDQ